MILQLVYIKTEAHTMSKTFTLCTMGNVSLQSFANVIL